MKLVKVSQSSYFCCQGLEFSQGLSGSLQVSASIKARSRSCRQREAEQQEAGGGGNHQAGGRWTRLKIRDLSFHYASTTQY